jgi:hypothetical protein
MISRNNYGSVGQRRDRPGRVRAETLPVVTEWTMSPGRCSVCWHGRREAAVCLLMLLMPLGLTPAIDPDPKFVRTKVIQGRVL